METKEVTITANAGKEKERNLTISLDMPQSLDEAKETFTEKVVLDVFNAQYVIKAQAAGRSQLTLEDKETGLPSKTDDEVKEYMKSWKLTGGNRSKLTPKDKLMRNFKGMTKEEIIAAINELDDSDLAGESDESEDGVEDAPEE